MEPPDASLQLITWEKGYSPEPWDETRATTRFGVERPRNNSRDVRLYQFSVIDQQMVRMDTTNKTLMDAIKICARNLFYQALAPFKKLYNNHPDDPVRFRELTRFDGVLRLGAAGMEVHLVTHMHLAPKQRRIITEVLGTINASAPAARRQRPQDGVAPDR